LAYFSSSASRQIDCGAIGVAVAAGGVELMR
jgi:hypothetical protein